MTVAEAAVGLALLGLFVVFEFRSQHPLIDLRIFKERAFAASAARGDGHLLLVVREPLRSHSVPSARSRLQPVQRRPPRAALCDSYGGNVSAVRNWPNEWGHVQSSPVGSS